jgi:hypothetical protein
MIFYGRQTKCMDLRKTYSSILDNFKAFLMRRNEVYFINRRSEVFLFLNTIIRNGHNFYSHLCQQYHQYQANCLSSDSCEYKSFLNWINLLTIVYWVSGGGGIDYYKTQPNTCTVHYAVLDIYLKLHLVKIVPAETGILANEIFYNLG